MKVSPLNEIQYERELVVRRCYAFARHEQAKYRLYVTVISGFSPQKSSIEKSSEPWTVPLPPYSNYSSKSMPVCSHIPERHNSYSGIPVQISQAQHSTPGYLFPLAVPRRPTKRLSIPETTVADGRASGTFQKQKRRPYSKPALGLREPS